MTGAAHAAQDDTGHKAASEVGTAKVAVGLLALEGGMACGNAPVCEIAAGTIGSNERCSECGVMQRMCQLLCEILVEISATEGARRYVASVEHDIVKAATVEAAVWQ